MKYLVIVCLAFSVVSVSAIPSYSAKWTCKAKNLKSYNYTGGNRAYIHLSPYKDGNRYRVTKTGEGRAEGKAKDGTKFVCTLG